ncbi:SCP2 sterol-binding domain-containing protein [Virgibacillus natechei]
MGELNEIFKEIDAAITADPSHAKGVEAVYQFNLDSGDSGIYQLVLRGDESYATEGEKEKPDCTLNMGADDFKKMVDGELNGTKAFMSGRLKIKGNMGLALKLQDILGSYKQTT